MNDHDDIDAFWHEDDGRGSSFGMRLEILINLIIWAVIIAAAYTAWQWGVA